MSCVAKRIDYSMKLCTDTLFGQISLIGTKNFGPMPNMETEYFVSQCVAF